MNATSKGKDVTKVRGWTWGGIHIYLHDIGREHVAECASEAVAQHICGLQNNYPATALQPADAPAVDDDKETDWYEHNGSFHVDWSLGKGRQLSILLNPDGHVGFAALIADLRNVARNLRKDAAMPRDLRHWYAEKIEAAEAKLREAEQTMATLAHARVASRLIHGFMLECNAIGLVGAAENLHKGIKQHVAAITGAAE